jgi:DNA/RNA endonuclease YhcR with UshA esterase domain
MIMDQLLEKNKIPLAIIIAAFVIAASIWLSKRPPSAAPQIAQTSQQSSKPAQPPQSSLPRISFSQAPDYIGKSVCVTGKVDRVYTSQKGTVFINFCPDYKTCPFGAVIFASSVPKFPNPQQYAGKDIEITGFITAYQGRPEIVIESPDQIKIGQ